MNQGLGQYTPAQLQQMGLPANYPLSHVAPQGVMAGLGGFALLVGVIGAVVSKEYREAFLITGGAGLASTVIAYLWMGNDVANAMQAAPPAATAPVAPTPGV